MGFDGGSDGWLIPGLVSSYTGRMERENTGDGMEVEWKGGMKDGSLNC